MEQADGIMTTINKRREWQISINIKIKIVNASRTVANKCVRHVKH